MPKDLANSKLFALSEALPSRHLLIYLCTEGSDLSHLEELQSFYPDLPIGFGFQEEFIASVAQSLPSGLCKLPTTLIVVRGKVVFCSSLDDQLLSAISFLEERPTPLKEPLEAALASGQHYAVLSMNGCKNWPLDGPSERAVQQLAGGSFYSVDTGAASPALFIDGVEVADFMQLSNDLLVSLLTYDISTRIRKLIAQHRVLVFIKGTPEDIRCGFSRQLVEQLGKHNIEFASFDVLADERMRSGLKEFSGWPTYPQIFVNGRLMGGLDVAKERLSQDVESFLA